MTEHDYGGEFSTTPKSNVRVKPLCDQNMIMAVNSPLLQNPTSEFSRCATQNIESKIMPMGSSAKEIE
jgi:hypothetical protein